MNQPNVPEDTATQGTTVPDVSPDERPSTGPIESQKGAPPTGRRAALRDIRRQFSPEEMWQSINVKWLLSTLEDSDVRCARLSEFEDRFHDADKRAKLRCSHENRAVIRLYEDLLGEPGGKKSHELLHRHYINREVR